MWIIAAIATKERIQLEVTGERVTARALRCLAGKGKECAADLPTRETAEALKERGLQRRAWGSNKQHGLGTRFNFH